MATKQESKVIAAAMQVSSTHQAVKRAAEEGSSKLASYQEKFKQALTMMDLSLSTLAKANVKASKERKSEPLEGVARPPSPPMDWTPVLNLGIEGMKFAYQIKDILSPQPRVTRKARVIDPNDVVDAEVVE